MLYVILVAAIIIFWLVAIDRPILVVSFKDGHLVLSIKFEVQRSAIIS
ncbi:DUF3634 family protein, partial [Vibrio cholerae]